MIMREEEEIEQKSNKNLTTYWADEARSAEVKVRIEGSNDGRRLEFGRRRYGTARCRRWSTLALGVTG